MQRLNNLKFSRILKRNKTISQINVTPMGDVMLVLLVIFMITAPLLTVGVPINLPKTKAKALPEEFTANLFFITQKYLISDANKLELIIKMASFMI